MLSILFQPQCVKWALMGLHPPKQLDCPWGVFHYVSQALQNNLAKIYSAKSHICGENLKPKLCTCAQSIALGKRRKFRLEILIRCMISAIHKFRENILESSQNVSETSPGDPAYSHVVMSG